ncbi:hypothetical protein Goari_004415 [Gossypium aridum]|uniref:EMC1 first beta-propeller domain-containing protein n=1 Tax=Gossypium aridum TaxID=34290 RepID=A0A7J8Y3E4_GOSAI|nr:hypothetical protein [Gossypium aridum]
MAIRSFFLFILFFSSSLSPVFSLYEDQVGLMDWHQQYIGKVKQAVFSSQRAGRKRVVVSTEENVIASLDLRHGEIFWRHLLGADDVIDGIDIGLGKYVITLSSGGSILRSWNLPDGQMVWESSLQGPKHSKSFLVVPTNLKFDKDNVLVVFSNGRLHAISCIDGEVLWKKDFEAESFEVQQVIQPPGSDLIYVVGFAASYQFEMYQINAKNGELLKHESASFSSGFSGEISLVSTETVVALDSTGSYGFRVLIVMEDHSLLLLQQGEIVWSREDGLASIIDVTTSELPVERNGVSVAKVEHNLFEWLKMHFDDMVSKCAPFLKGHMLKLKGTLMLASPEDMAAIQSMRLKSSEKSKMTRDHNGFRKLLIVLTRAGKLFALHTGDGRIVWSHLLRSLHKSEACQSPIGLNLYQWQVPHHHAMDENPSVLVVSRCGPSSDTPGVLSFVDTYTGKELSSLSLDHAVVQVIPLPYTDSTEQRLHLLINADKHAHLYPKTSEALSIFKREFLNIYWYSVEDQNGIIKGHALKCKCTGKVADEFCFDTRDLWSVVFPSESEKIVATVTRKLNEVKHFSLPRVFSQ